MTTFATDNSQAAIPGTPAPGTPSIDGLVYLLNQAGEALSEANKRILAYSQENTILRQVIEAMRNPEEIKTAEDLVDEGVTSETLSRLAQGDTSPLLT